MAWTTPITAVTGNVHTAAQFNTSWRDNLLMSEAAVASTVGNLVVASAFKEVEERQPGVSFVADYDSTTSTSYTDLGGFSSVVATASNWALVSIGAAQSNDTAGLGSYTAVAVSGDTTIAASATYALYSESGNAGDGFQATFTVIVFPLNPGLHLFELNHRTTAGGGTSTFGRRLLAVLPF